MPNTREKLVDLLNEAEEYEVNTCMFHSECEDCPGRKYGDNCRDCLKADYLIANGVTVQKWIPVSERLPEEDGRYLVFERGYLIPSIRVLSFARDGRKVDKYDFHRGWKNVWYRYDSEWGHLTTDDVTHWMPLPEAPKGE